MRKVMLLIICLIMFSGCAVDTRLKPEKFQIYPEVMKQFSSDKPITIIIPQNAEKDFLIEKLGGAVSKPWMNYIYNQAVLTPERIHCDLNDLYKIADEHIKDTLNRNKVPLSSNSSKYIKFTITKIQAEDFGVAVIGIYLYFDIETSDGYKQNYKVQDQSPTYMDKAIGGAVSRAVETIFQDKNIIKFIETSN